MNINMKIGNIPDDVVRHSMDLWGQHVAAEVRDLEGNDAPGRNRTAVEMQER